jgi:hypothetical protein
MNCLEIPKGILKTTIDSQNLSLQVGAIPRTLSKGKGYIYGFSTDLRFDLE